MSKAKSEHTDENERQPFKKSKSGTLPQGTPVICNGYRGSIIRHYDGAMYEIRLPRGSVCTDEFRIIDYAVDTSPAEQPAKQGKPELPRDYSEAYRKADRAQARLAVNAMIAKSPARQAQPAKQGEHSPLQRAKRALDGDSNDAEHDALFALVEAHEALSNHAGKLAEALRDLRDVSWPDPACAKADAALAAWKKANLAESKV